MDIMAVWVLLSFDELIAQARLRKDERNWKSKFSQADSASGIKAESFFVCTEANGRNKGQIKRVITCRGSTGASPTFLLNLCGTRTYALHECFNVDPKRQKFPFMCEETKVSMCIAMNDDKHESGNVKLCNWGACMSEHAYDWEFFLLSLRLKKYKKLQINNANYDTSGNAFYIVQVLSTICLLHAFISDALMSKERVERYVS